MWFVFSGGQCSELVLGIHNSPSQMYIFLSFDCVFTFNFCLPLILSYLGEPVYTFTIEMMSTMNQFTTLTTTKTQQTHRRIIGWVELQIGQTFFPITFTRWTAVYSECWLTHTPYSTSSLQVKVAANSNNWH